MSHKECAGLCVGGIHCGKVAGGVLHCDWCGHSFPAKPAASLDPAAPPATPHDAVQKAALYAVRHGCPVNLDLESYCAGYDQALKDFEAWLRDRHNHAQKSDLLGRAASARLYADVLASGEWRKP